MPTGRLHYPGRPTADEDVSWPLIGGVAGKTASGAGQAATRPNSIIPDPKAARARRYYSEPIENVGIWVLTNQRKKHVFLEMVKVLGQNLGFTIKNDISYQCQIFIFRHPKRSSRRIFIRQITIVKFSMAIYEAPLGAPNGSDAHV